MRLRKDPRKTEDYLFTLGVASLEVLEPQTRLGVGRQRPKPRPGVMIRLKDWEHMRAHESVPVQLMGDPGDCGE